MAKAYRPRPWVTLTYAQSIDGSIAARQGAPLALSGPEALRMTHRLRAEHDAILVGIGTILADNPQLTVRLVEGESPQPVVLDSQFRFPAGARVVDHPKKPWIMTTCGISEMDSARQNDWKMLKSKGVKLFAVSPTSIGQVKLTDMLMTLFDAGIRRLMVEGGARVITAFLRERLVDEVIVTIAPIFTGGLHAIETLVDGPTGFPRLGSARVEPCGSDWILRGTLL